ncbi:S-protein homolog 5-like [Macadamia integrifolia]|uniref:S-protein homolog 5-like n=1 Tax=Macadamia integrifolia TaxID=60698 RepID=UPI001C4F3184|nr:S-protein homolog 5-like [Macadamia integrifolia]
MAKRPRARKWDEEAMGEGYVLTIHCKSRDDDLGVHYLPHNEYFDWRFNDNIWGSTLFFCHFQWRDADVYFDIYDATRDRLRCSLCWWSARIDALYSVDYNTGAAEAWLHWHGSLSLIELGGVDGFNYQ